MSAANRGEERYEFDDYPTPAWCVHRLLEKANLPGGLWIDPCAGAGAIIKAVPHDGGALPGHPIQIAWHANEIQARYKQPLLQLAEAVEIGDVTKWEEHNGHPFYDVWITNPPYSVAEEVIKVGMQHARYVVMLLRLNFFGSKHRYPWISKYMPRTVAVLPDRPAFRLSKKTGKVGTDATEYAWFVWKRYDHEGVWERKETSLIMLNLTDPKILAADKERIRLAAATAGLPDNRTRSDTRPPGSPSEGGTLSVPPLAEPASDL